MRLEDTAIYSVVLILANGTKLTICPIEIKGKHQAVQFIVQQHTKHTNFQPIIRE